MTPRYYYRDPAQRKIAKLNKELSALQIENAALRKQAKQLTSKAGLQQAKWEELVRLKRACESYKDTKDWLLTQHQKQKSRIAFLTYLACFSLGLLGFLLIVMFGAK